MTRRYDHSQRAPLGWIMTLLGVVVLAGATAVDEPPARGLVAGLGGLFILLGLAFGHLRVRDVGDALELRFGPLPIAKKRVPYATIRAVEPARSKWIDGWGIHWVPGRGWTWNLWGYDCVELQTTRGPLRIGTDEPKRLATFLRERIAQGDGPA